MLSIELAFVEGLEQVRWPGRLMEVSSHPSIWLDGSHNPQGGAVLAENLKACFPDREISFIVGFLEDKDVAGYANMAQAGAASLGRSVVVSTRVVS